MKTKEELIRDILILLHELETFEEQHGDQNNELKVFLTVRLQTICYVLGEIPQHLIERVEKFVEL